MPHWDLLTPSSLCSHAKVTVRLSQSSFTEWNIDSNVLAEILHQPGEWQAGPWAGWDQQAPNSHSGLPQTSLSPCLPWKELEMLPSAKTTQTSLCSGWEKFLLVHLNSAEGRTDPPGTLRPAAGREGSETALQKEFQCALSFVRQQGGLQRARQGARGDSEQGAGSEEGAGGLSRGTDCTDPLILQLCTPGPWQQQLCNSPRGRGTVSSNAWSVFPVKAVWGSTLHHSLGVSSYSLTTGSNNLPATTSEPSCCKKDSRSGFIHCPCCKLSSALLKSLKFVICHKPCHQTSAVSAGVVEIEQSEGFG